MDGRVLMLFLYSGNLEDIWHKKVTVQLPPKNQVELLQKWNGMEEKWLTHGDAYNIIFNSGDLRER